MSLTVTVESYGHQSPGTNPDVNRKEPKYKQASERVIESARESERVRERVREKDQLILTKFPSTASLPEAGGKAWRQAFSHPLSPMLYIHRKLESCTPIRNGTWVGSLLVFQLLDLPLTQEKCSKQ